MTQNLNRRAKSSPPNLLPVSGKVGGYEKPGGFCFGLGSNGEPGESGPLPKGLVSSSRPADRLTNQTGDLGVENLPAHTDTGIGEGHDGICASEGQLGQSSEEVGVMRLVAYLFLFLEPEWQSGHGNSLFPPYFGLVPGPKMGMTKGTALTRQRWAQRPLHQRACLQDYLVTHLGCPGCSDEHSATFDCAMSLRRFGPALQKVKLASLGCSHSLSRSRGLPDVAIVM